MPEPRHDDAGVAVAATARRRPRRLLIAFTAVMTWALYAPTLAFDAIWDDHVAVEANEAVRGADWTQAWTSPFWGPREATRVATWRPLVTSMWAAEHAAAGALGVDAVAVHRAGNLLAFAALVALLGLLLDALGAGVAATWVAMAWLALHPLAVEPLCWLVARADTLALAATLVALRALWRGRDAVAVAAFLVALLCKEAAIAALLPLALVAVVDLRAGRRDRPATWRLGAAFAGAIALWLLGRVAVLGGLVGGAPGEVENPLVAVAGLARAVEGLRVAGLALGGVFGAVAPRPDWGLGAFPIGGGPGWPALGASALLALVAIAARSARRGDRALALAAGLGLAPLLFFAQPLLDLPAANADRFWLPLVAAVGVGLGRGVDVALGGGVDAADGADAAHRADGVASPRARALCFGALVAASLMMALWLAATPARLAPWRDDTALFEHVLAVTPSSYRGLVNRADADVRRGEVGRALAALERAVAMAPSAAFGHLALGRAAVAAGALDRVEAAARALDGIAGPGGPDAGELRCAAAVRGQDGAALARCEAALRASGRPRPLTWMWLALARDAAGDAAGAADAFARAVAAAAPAPPDALIFRNHGVFLARHGQMAAAAHALAAAVDSGDASAASTLLAVCARLDASADAAERALAARLRARYGGSNSGHPSPAR